MFRAETPASHPLVLSLFGCQHDSPSPTAAQTTLITTFTALLTPAATHIETLTQAGASPSHPSTHIWMAYWPSPDAYDTWWSSPAVSTFWHALPPATAGFWRETLRLDHARTMFQTNKPVANGLASVAELAPLTEKTGYWGAYRDRLADKALGTSVAGRLAPRKATAGAAIREGRVAIQHFPENLCFVVEGQDYAVMGAEERAHWREHFDGLARTWVERVVNAGADEGVVVGRLCHAPGKGRVDGEAVEAGGLEWPEAFGFNRKVQILYFLDMSYMEAIGKKVKAHVELRRGFMKAYSPGGAMEEHDLLLWVELSVVKARDVDAEYIGCYEGTGFMAYLDDPAFQAQQTGLSKD